MNGPPSVFNQGDVTLVERARLMPESPRNYNASIIEHRGRRWMAYRSHRIDQQGRCAIAMCEMTATWQPKGRSHWINLPVERGVEHHEDPRLFVFQGALHLTFTEIEFHPPDRPYTCVIKYCRLARRGKVWTVDGPIHQPRYGRNDGMHQEKNWQFFDDHGTLRVIYEAEPHRILELDGVRVKREQVGPLKATAWPWGVIRGGTPPIRIPSGHWLTFFHSATWYPEPPHWRRYYSGAYIFEPEPPWKIAAISHEPMLTGSAQDGHAMDPRNIDSWKPFVVFPCGVAIDPRGGFFVSYGINDHLTAIARHTDFELGAADFSDWPHRYFHTDNASMPLRHFPDDRSIDFMPWQPVGRPIAGTQSGVMAATNPRIAQMLDDLVPLVREITRAEFIRLGGRLR